MITLEKEDISIKKKQLLINGYALKKIDKTKLNAREKEFLRDEIQIVS